MGLSPPEGAPTRWRIELSWDGRDFVGWQRQPNGRSIQAEVEQALARVLGGEQVRVEATGRTDAGVHALQQVAAFDAVAARSPRGLVGGLNHHLPRDVACLSAQVAPAGFDPRRWTRRKTYRYRILTRWPRCPLRDGRVLHLGQALDVPAMEAAARLLEGRHDVASFQAAGCSAAHTLRTVEAVRVLADPEEVRVEVVGHGFVRHQVRIMAGTLVEVGLGRRPASWVGDVLAARDRDQAGPTLPAHGLWLVEVDCPLAPRPGGEGEGAIEPDPEDDEPLG